MEPRCRFLLLCSILLLTACESVFVGQPLGKDVVVLDEATWQGQWLNGEVVITTTVIDAENGILQAAWIERGEHGAELEIATGYVRKTGDHIYLSLPNLDSNEVPIEGNAPAKSPEYHWARLDHDQRTATLWWPNQDRFREAVKSGQLPGTIKDDDDVLLDELSTEQLELINSPESNLLGWTEPMMLVRIGD